MSIKNPLLDLFQEDKQNQEAELASLQKLPDGPTKESRIRHLKWLLEETTAMWKQCLNLRQPLKNSDRRQISQIRPISGKKRRRIRGFPCVSTECRKECKHHIKTLDIVALIVTK